MLPQAAKPNCGREIMRTATADAQRSVEAAEQRVSECKAALQEAEAAAAEARASLAAAMAEELAEAAARAEAAEARARAAEARATAAATASNVADKEDNEPVPPPAATGMKGIFARSSALPETKAERREAMEIAELRKMEEPPVWVEASLLHELRAAGSAETFTLETAPLNVMSRMATAKQVVRLPKQAAAAGCDRPEGRESAWWAVLLAGEEEEDSVLCVGQDDDGRLIGAWGVWPAGTVSRASQAVAASAASRCWRLNDGSSTAEWMQHVTVTGLGEGGAAPVPAARNLLAPPPCHLAEAVREGLLARRQIRARLQRGGAAEAERAHCRLLLDGAQVRLEASAREAAQNVGGSLGADVGQCEAAVQGLRKTLLPRTWEPRCVECGVRHKDIEIHTCKFWREWAAAATPCTGEE